MPCNMCGQCCRNINMPIGTHNKLLRRNNLRSIDSHTGKIVSDDFHFIKKHWKYLGLSKEIGGFKYGGKYFEVFECEFVTEDNKCSIHKNKPQVCSGYPWYSNEVKYINGSFPWPYRGCGYERISHKRDLVAVLIKIIERKKEEVKASPEDPRKAEEG